MNFADVVQKAIPDADAATVDYIVFNRTPFPFKALTAKEVYRAADRWRRAMAHGIMLCEMCNNEARENDWICAHCERMLYTRSGDDK